MSSATMPALEVSDNGNHAPVVAPPLIKSTDPLPIVPVETVTPPATPVPTPPATAKAKKVSYYADIYPGEDTPLPEDLTDFAEAVLELEAKLGHPVWTIIQDGRPRLGAIGGYLQEVLVSARQEFKPGQEISIILHTPGGDPDCAYRIAAFLQRRCGSFNVLVPNIAKSGGTLWALGAKSIQMGEIAELGPLDIQIRDLETDIWDSALNETQALQNLTRESLTLYYANAALLKKLYHTKQFDTVSKISFNLVTEMVRPLVEKIDAVHYNKMVRHMRIMKMYAETLMKRAGYAAQKASEISEALVEQYPDHGYVIDVEEAKQLGLKITEPDTVVQGLLRRIESACSDEHVLLGRVRRKDEDLGPGGGECC